MKVPDARRRNKALFPAALSATVAILLFSSYSSASEWRVLPRLNLIETYSDNVTLRAGNPSDDFITQINPGVSLRGLASRYKVDATYVMNNLLYAQNSNFNRIQNQLNANGTGELVKDLFFVDGRAAIAQQNITLVGRSAYRQR